MFVFSCAIVLLQQEANVNHEIVLYDPVVERQKESPVKVQEKIQSVEKKEKTVLKWRPLQQQQKKETERKREAYSIFQVNHFVSIYALYAACKTVRLKDSDKLSWSVYEFTEAVSNLSKIAILLFFWQLYLPLTLLLCITFIVATHIL